MSRKGLNITWFLLLMACCFAFQIGFLSESVAAKKGGVIKVGIGGSPKTLDPHNEAGDETLLINSNVFETLLYFNYDQKDKKAKPMPSLATSWEKSKDGLAYTFKLRKGVKFHDGTPFDAQAVKFNFERIIQCSYGRDIKEVFDHAEVIDNFTVKIHLNKPLAIFLNLIELYNAQMISPTAFKKYGDKFGLSPVGTGKFKFTKWVPGDYIQLQAYEGHWGGRPNLDGIIFRFVPDNNARLSMLQTGELDLVYNVPYSEHERLRKTGNIGVETWPCTSNLRMSIHNIYPYDDVMVRQAIKYAIDRKAIVRDILVGNGYPSDSPSAPMSWGYYPANPPVYDPDKAKQLLTEAGWVDKDGDGIREKGADKLVFTINCTPPGRGQMRGEIALAIQEYLRQVGFDCKLIIEDFGSLIMRFETTRDKAREGAFLSAWSSKSDAWFVLYTCYYSKKWYPNGRHMTFWINPEFDRILEQAAVEINDQKRFELYKQAQIIHAREAPDISLCVEYHTLAKHKYVQGVRYDPIPVQDSFVNIREAWLDK